MVVPFFTFTSQKYAFCSVPSESSHSVERSRCRQFCRPDYEDKMECMKHWCSAILLVPITLYPIVMLEGRIHKVTLTPRPTCSTACTFPGTSSNGHGWESHECPSGPVNLRRQSDELGTVQTAEINFNSTCETAVSPDDRIPLSAG